MSADELEFQLFSSLRFDAILLKSLVNTTLSGSPSPFYMLPYHRDRMLAAAISFNWTEAAASIRGPNGLHYLQEQLRAVIDMNSTTPLRVRIVLHRTGAITVETNETPPVQLKNLYPTRIPPPSAGLQDPISTLEAQATGKEEPGSVGLKYDDPQKEKPWILMVDPSKTTASSFTTYKTTCRDMYVRARAAVGIESMTEPREVLIVSDRANEIMEGSLTSVFFWRSDRWVTPTISSGGQAGTTRRWSLEEGFCKEAVVKTDSLIDGEECWISNGVRGWIFGRVKL